MPQIQDTLYLEQNLPMPFSLEAEQSVLGAVLVDSSCLTTVMEYVKPECFYDKRHQGIFSVMLRFCFGSLETLFLFFYAGPQGNQALGVDFRLFGHHAFSLEF